MKHPPKENPGTCTHACVHTRVQCYPAAALALCAGSRISFIAEFPFPCCPEGASSSLVSGRGSSIPHQLGGKNSMYCMCRMACSQPGRLKTTQKSLRAPPSWAGAPSQHQAGTGALRAPLACQTLLSSQRWLQIWQHVHGRHFSFGSQ